MNVKYNYSNNVGNSVFELNSCYTFWLDITKLLCIVMSKQESVTRERKQKYSNTYMK